MAKSVQILTCGHITVMDYGGREDITYAGLVNCVSCGNGLRGTPSPASKLRIEWNEAINHGRT